MTSENPTRPALRTGPRLVIADDSADMRWLIRSILAPEFGEIVEAADGRQLIWALIRTQEKHHLEPDTVVVADVYMPVYDGLEVLHAWQDGESRVPVVIVTAFPNDDVRQIAARLGAVLLAKPFLREELRAAVATAIARVRDRQRPS